MLSRCDLECECGVNDENDIVGSTARWCCG